METKKHNMFVENVINEWQDSLKEGAPGKKESILMDVIEQMHSLGDQFGFNADQIWEMKKFAEDQLGRECLRDFQPLLERTKMDTIGLF